ncbi:MAG: FtsX-like permease family protein [Vicinamibacterales bacterium]
MSVSGLRPPVLPEEVADGVHRQVRRSEGPAAATAIEQQFLGRSRGGFAFPGRVLPVDHDLFATLGTRLLAGRPFSPGEIAQQAMVAIVNEAAAAVVGAGSPVGALGRTLATEDGPRVIVGVVEDLRMAPGREPDLTLLSDGLRTRPWMSPRWVGASRESVAARVGLDLEVPRLLALVFGTLGGTALLLQLISIAGLASFEVGRRREEMTVRLALGATVSSLRARLAIGVVRPIVVGVVLAVPLSWVMTTLLARSLSTIDAGAPHLYVVPVVTMIVVALITGWASGWRSVTLRVSELLRTS